MSDLLPQATPAGPMVVITTIVLFGITLVALSWGARSFGQGLGTLAAAWVAGPFVYLRRVARNLGRFGELGESAYSDTDQILLRRLIHALETILLFAATLVLSATLALSVAELIPPIEARQQLRAVRIQLSAAQEELTGVKTSLARLDQEWNSSKSATIERVRREDAKRVSEAQAALERIESRLERTAGLSNAPAVLHKFVERKMSGEDPKIPDIKAELRSGLHRELEASLAAAVDPWVDCWGQLEEARITAALSSEQEIRGRTQSTWRDLSAKGKRIEDQVGELRRDEAKKAEAASPKPGVAFKILLTGFGLFLLGVWGVGLVLEWLSLAVNVAGDIRELRSTLAPAKVLKPTPQETKPVLGGSMLSLEA